MCPLEREQATRVSYNTLTHSRLYCRDREKKQVMNIINSQFIRDMVKIGVHLRKLSQK